MEKKVMGVKLRVILVAVVTMLLCVALIAFGTYALFTDQKKLVGHLQAGTLKIELWRTNLTYCSLGADGYEYENNNPEDINFTEATDRNLFDLQSDTVIAPGCYYEATLEIRNAGTVAFAWWLEFKLSGEASKLSEQIEVTVTQCNQDGTELKDESGAAVFQRNGRLSEGTIVGSETDPVGHFAISGNNLVATFKVKIEFKNLDDDGSINNLAQDAETAFDLIVNAVQELQNPQPQA